VTALQNLPLVFHSLEECAYVRGKLEDHDPREDARAGFRAPVPQRRRLGALLLGAEDRAPGRPEEGQALHLGRRHAAGRPDEEPGPEPVPLEPTDILVGLQTGLVDAVPMVPFFAQIAQLHDKAKYMLDLDWAPLVGGGVITKKAWDALDEAQQKLVRESARRPAPRSSSRTAASRCSRSRP
jgi:hypothetical protein